MTEPHTVEVTREAPDRDCRLLDALDFQVGAVARVSGEYAADWPEPVRILGIEKYRGGRLNITIGDLDGGCVTDGFSVDEITPVARRRLASTPPLPATEMARLFHETYERLAPSFGYETRADTKAFDPESPNGKLMIAVCGEVARASTPIVIAAERINCEAMSINKGRTVTVDFANRDDAFALFNELKDRSLPLAPEG